MVGEKLKGERTYLVCSSSSSSSSSLSWGLPRLFQFSQREARHTHSLQLPLRSQRNKGGRYVLCWLYANWEKKLNWLSKPFFYTGTQQTKWAVAQSAQADSSARAEKESVFRNRKLYNMHLSLLRTIYRGGKKSGQMTEGGDSLKRRVDCAKQQSRHAQFC